MRRASLILVLFLAACGGGGADEAAKAPAPAVDTPAQLATKLYALPAVPNDKASVEAYFIPEFTAGMAPAAGTQPALDWDYRYDSKDPKITDVAVTVEKESAAAARIRVTFKNDGTADAMVYNFCKREDGQWRIRDIIDPDPDGMSLRGRFGLGVIRAGHCPMPEA